MARFFQFQNVARPPQVDENITVDKWFEPLTEPVRHKIVPKLAIALIASGLTQSPRVEPVQPIVVTTSGSEVIFKSRLIYQSLAHVPFNEKTTPDKWFEPLSEPVRQKQGLQARFQKDFFYGYSAEETITIDKWFEPLSEPVRIKVSVRAGSQQFFGTDTDPVVTFSWMNELSLPPKAKTSIETASQQADVVPPFVEDTTFESKWHEPWSEPVRLKPGLRASLQDSVADIAFNEDAGILTKWYQPLSEPVRVRRLSIAQQGVITPVFVSEVIYEDKWHFPWSEPVRQKTGLGTRYQISLAWSTTTPEPTSVDKWWEPLSEPVRSRPSLRAGSQPITAKDTNPVVSFSWFGWLAEPPKPKVTIRLGSQQFAAIPPFNEDTTFESKWHQPWSEPVRVRWFKTALQQDLVWEPVFVTELIFEDKWHQPWSEPVRFKRGEPAYQQQTLAFAARPPIVSFSYYNWLTEPVRPKKGLQKQYQSSFTADPTVIPTGRLPGWLYPFNEPVRQKLSLRTALQQTVTSATPIQPILPDLRNAWFAPWSEPVREKKGLLVGLQQFFGTDSAPLTPEVFVTIAATETNADIAEFYGVVYNRAVSAHVSIRELRPLYNANVSLSQLPSFTDTGAYYVTEDGLIYYVTEDGQIFYVWRTPLGDPT